MSVHPIKPIRDDRYVVSFTNEQIVVIYDMTYSEIQTELSRAMRQKMLANLDGCLVNPKYITSVVPG